MNLHVTERTHEIGGYKGGRLFERAHLLFRKAVGSCGLNDVVDARLSENQAVQATLERRVLQSTGFPNDDGALLVSEGGFLNILRMPSGIVEISDRHICIARFRPNGTGLVVEGVNKPYDYAWSAMDIDRPSITPNARVELLAQVIFSATMQA